MAGSRQQNRGAEEQAAPAGAPWLSRQHGGAGPHYGTAGSSVGRSVCERAHLATQPRRLPEEEKQQLSYLLINKVVWKEGGKRERRRKEGRRKGRKEGGLTLSLACPSLHGCGPFRLYCHLQTFR